MKKSLPIFVAILLVLCASINNTQAQLYNYGYKVGLQASYVDVANEFEGDGLSMQFRPFARFELGSLFDLGVGIGYGMLSMKDYGGNEVNSSYIPIDARLLFSPIESDVWNPYLSVGGGALIWSVNDKSIQPLSNTDDSGTNFYIPAGAGIEFALSDHVLLDVHAGWNLALTDAMNGYETPNASGDYYSNDRWWNYGVGIAYSGGGCGADSDNDGLTDCEEEELGTDPGKADSDDDGLTDGDEFMKYKTDPLKADSDGDGLKDGAEISTHQTDPNKADSDGDELSDGDEVNTYDTDPLNVDTDGDTIKDGLEVNKYKTNPTQIDTDGDGLMDGAEVFTNKTDPLKTDTDGDKLSDGDEVKKYKTDPLVTDTDKGSVDDGTEVLVNSTDPLDASDDILLPKVSLEVYFDLNKSKLLPETISALEEALPAIKKVVEAGKTISLTGHCDAMGSEAYNEKLSVNRANAVAKWLIKNGVDDSKLTKEGLGKSAPKYNSDKDRRVELEVK